MFKEEEYISIMMESLANGYLLKDVTPDEIHTAIISALNTSYYFNNTINQLLLSNKLKLKLFEKETVNKSNNLTEPEFKLINLLTQGKLLEDIAKELSVSERTLEGIKYKVQKKLGVKNTLGLILYAIKHNLIKI